MTRDVLGNISSLVFLECKVGVEEFVVRDDFGELIRVG